MSLSDNESLTASATAEAVSISDDNSFDSSHDVTNVTNDEAEIVFLSVVDVIRLHRDGILRYTPQEPQAIRDIGLLESAVFTPQQTWGGEYLYPSLEGMAAAYLVGLASNHAFEQGNKRVAFAACSLFLRYNGCQLTLTEEEATNLTKDYVNNLIARDDVEVIIANASIIIE